VRNFQFDLPRKKHECLADLGVFPRPPAFNKEKKLINLIREMGMYLIISEECFTVELKNLSNR